MLTVLVHSYFKVEPFYASFSYNTPAFIFNLHTSLTTICYIFHSLFKLVSQLKILSQETENRQSIFVFKDKVKKNSLNTVFRITSIVQKRPKMTTCLLIITSHFRWVHISTIFKMAYGKGKPIEVSCGYTGISQHSAEIVFFCKFFCSKKAASCKCPSIDKLIRGESYEFAPFSLYLQ
jgi:hypothetical protein